MIQKETILVVEDEANIREILTFNLENAGYTVQEAASAEQALQRLDDSTALILLDVMLPGMSGLEMAEQLRRDCNNTPVIFLTALSTETDLVRGFSAGGDDYVSKPFSVVELLHRVKAVLKRCPHNARDVFHSGPLTIDYDARQVLIDGNPIEMPKKEYDLLCLLAANPNTYFSRQQLLAQLWKETPFVLERTVDVHIARIRNRLGKHRNLIQNKTGFGYCLNTGHTSAMP